MVVLILFCWKNSIYAHWMSMEAHLLLYHSLLKGRESHQVRTRHLLKIPFISFLTRHEPDLLPSGNVCSLPSCKDEFPYSIVFLGFNET
jgi:hypothetical protein